MRPGAFGGTEGKATPKATPKTTPWEGQLWRGQTSDLGIQCLESEKMYFDGFWMGIHHLLEGQGRHGPSHLVVPGCFWNLGEAVVGHGNWVSV